MASWKDILLDTLKLTDEVKRLNDLTEKLSDRTVDMDKRLVRLETMVEIAQKQLQKNKKSRILNLSRRYVIDAINTPELIAIAGKLVIFAWANHDLLKPKNQASSLITGVDSN